MLFDDILDIVSGYDLLTPLLSFGEDAKPHTKFGVNILAGFTKAEVRRALEGAGIDAWGFIDAPEDYTIIFNVRKDQTREAYDILKEAEIPVLYPVLED